MGRGAGHREESRKGFLLRLTGTLHYQCIRQGGFGGLGSQATSPGRGIRSVCGDPWPAGTFHLTADDLRDALVAHPQHPRDVGHWQAVLVRLPDRLVAVGPQPLGSPLQPGFTPGVVLRECGQVGAGLRCLALGTGDSAMVRLIPANRLA